MRARDDDDDNDKGIVLKVLPLSKGRSDVARAGRGQHYTRYSVRLADIRRTTTEGASAAPARTQQQHQQHQQRQRQQQQQQQQEEQQQQHIMRANNYNPRRRVFQHYRPSTSVFHIRNLAMVVFAGTILALYIMAFSSGPHKDMNFKGGDKGPGAQLTAAGAGRKRGQAALGETEYNQNPPFHVVFSTSCSPFQDWQSLLLFLTADMVGQKGPLTRIASGCTLEEQAALEALYAKLDQGRNKFRLHFTPDFSKDQASGQTYYFYNKPGGLQHWLASPASPPDDTVIAVIDPDFIFMRPLTAKVKADGIIFSGPVQAWDLIEEVSVGHPAAQFYGIGDKWIEFNLTYIVGEDSPALAVNSMSAWKHYSIGPPYIVAKTDMVQIAQLWHSVVPRVYEGHPHLLAEMYAYSVAAAHLELPHLRLDGYMTSEAEGYGEAWPLVDVLTDESICSEDLSLRTTLLPSFLHYCQHYKVGAEFVYWKRDLDENFFSCGGSPLPLPNQEQVREYLDPTSGPALSVNDRAYHKYHAFQYCQVVMKTNKALQKYKSLFCDVDDNSEAEAASSIK